MIYTVTCNPSLDYWMEADLQMGQVNRATATGCSFGGKGLNVSAMLTRLGCPSVALGFAAGWTGEALLSDARRAGVATDFVRAGDPDALTRINVKIRGEQTTEINGAGSPLQEGDLHALLAKLEQVTAGDAVVLAGSLPPGVPCDLYARLVTELGEKGVYTVVDCEGVALVAAVKAGPFLVKPNRQELEGWAGKPLPTLEAVAEAARRMQATGAERVLVSLGGDGTLLVDTDGTCYRTEALKGRVLQTVGAGDAMLAGFLYGYTCFHGDVIQALRWGSCAGAATVFYGANAAGEQVRRLYEEQKPTVERLGL